MINKYNEIINNTLLEDQKIISIKSSMINNLAILQIDVKTNQVIWFSNDIYTIFEISPEEKNITLDFIFNQTTVVDKKEIKEKFKLLLNQGKKIDHLFKIKRKSDNETRYIYLNAEIKKDELHNPIHIMVVLTDITDLKTFTDQGNIADYMYRTLYNDSPYGIAIGDSSSGIIYKANKKYKELVPYKFEDNSTIDWMSITHPDDIQDDLVYMEKMNKGENHGFSIEKRYIRLDGSYIWVKMTIIPIIIEGEKINKHLCMIEDITDKKNYINEINFALHHDLLTGLYNRKFLYEEFSRLRNKNIFPISVIFGNINGMKVYNETFGHNSGDQEIIRIGNKINKFFNNEYKIARIGGDEFAVILIGHDQESLDKLTEDLNKYINKNKQNSNENILTISFGNTIQNTLDENIEDLLKKVEVFIYGKKFFDKRSTKSNTINLIMKTLFVKSEREQKHSQRVGDISAKIGKLMGFDELQINRIKTAGYFHDIGKIGIEENILNKKGKLNEVEWELVKLHTIKGAIILEQSPEYKDVRNMILSHHERFDGFGYPNGLVGENIPIEARIICLADAYDAMTEARPYKDTMSHEAALKEIDKCSGTQFDPVVVEIFIENFKNGLEIR